MTPTAVAADYKKNPFTLVYGGVKEQAAGLYFQRHPPAAPAAGVRSAVSAELCVLLENERPSRLDLQVHDEQFAGLDALGCDRSDRPD